MEAFALTSEQTVLCHQMASLAKLGGFIVDLTAGRCLWCSDEVARIHGREADRCAELLAGAAAPYPWIDSKDQERYRTTRETAVARQRGYSLQYRLQRADDDSRLVNEIGEVVVDPTSGHQRLIGTLQDITDERRIEEALQRANDELERRVAERTVELRAAEREAKASQDRFLAAAEALMDGLAIYDGEDRLVYHNRRYPDHAPPGFRAAMRLGKRFEDIIRAAAADGGMYHPEMGADFTDRRLADRRSPSGDREFRIADGRWVRVRESAIPGGGRVLLTSDISERKRAQEALEEREQLLETIADGIPLPIVIARISQPEILFVNALATEVFGLRIGPQPNPGLSGFLDPNDRRLLVDQLFRDNRVDGFEVRLKRADGTGMWALLSARAIIVGGQLAMLVSVTDITERKTALVELAEREERFRVIAEGVPLGVVIARPQPPEILFANALMCDAFGLCPGLAPEAIVGIYQHPEDRRRLLAQLEKAGQVDGFEARLRRRDGTTMWGLMSVRRLSFAGRPALLTAVTDITQLKATQQALEESEARLAAFMEHAPVGMYLKDIAGRYVMINPQTSRILGTGPGEMVGRTVGDSPLDHDHGFVAARDREVLESGKAMVSEERLLDPENSSWMVIRFPVRDAAGEITHIGGFDLDITERKRMEEALKVSEQRFRAFADAHPVPLFIAVIDTGRVIFASPPCAELLRLPLDELLAGTTFRFYAEPSDRARVMQQLRRDGCLDGREVHLRRADGTEFWAAFTSKRMSIEGEDAVVTAIVDLTERKRIDAELARQRQILYQNEKMSALGSLLANVAHELNNPLSVVVGHASLLEDTAADDATRNRALKIHIAADRCARIVRTFLAMARSKPQQRGAVDLNATVRDALEIVAYGLRTADVEVVTRLDPDLPPVWADGDQLHQVFANLFVNAQQSLQAIEAPRRLTVTSSFDADDVFVEVADNGPGVPEDIVDRIFEPFFTTKPQGVGTGVGLSVCHGIVTAHDGDISLGSHTTTGARFRVRLPRSTVAHSAAPPPHDGRRRRGRILVVDDEPEVGQLLTDMLELDGHRVERATSGREALRQLAAHDVDLIVSDLRMPDMDGPALYRELAVQRPDLLARIVFVTGDTLAADMTGFLSETGARVIEKPLAPRAVDDTVQAILAHHHNRAGAGGTVSGRRTAPPAGDAARSDSRAP